jgi:hypothetical protein
VDMRPYRRAHFLKVDDFRGKSPREFKIGAVTIGEKYGKPNLVFECGNQLSLNVSNVDTLCDAYGDDSETWVGQVVELKFGEVGGYDVIIVRAVSKLNDHEAAEAAAEKKKHNPLNDEIPF